MKIELRKETKAVTGEVWYYVYKDDSYMSETCTQDLDEAHRNYEGAIAYPEKKVEIMRSKEL